MKKLFFALSLVILSPVLRAQMSVQTGDSRRTVMSNGTLTVRIDQRGRVNSCEYNGTELIAKPNTWYLSYNSAKYHELGATTVTVKRWTDDLIEVVYSNDTIHGAHWSQGFILRKGVSGLYTYLVCEGTDTPEDIGEARVVYRLDDRIFRDGYVNEQAQGLMPDHETMKSIEKSGQIQDATFYLPDSSIYTKYNWAEYMRDDHFHGVMSDHTGVWAIGVSMEYVNGGPMRQDLMVHSDVKSTLLLQMFQAGHYGSASTHFETGVSKIYGPFFLYVNSGETREAMIADARDQAARQEQQWPFRWMDHPLYETERATVSGQIRITNKMPKSRLRVVLAQPGEVYRQGDDYIFWAETDRSGKFSIPHVRRGTYALHAYAIEGENTDSLELTGVEVTGTDTHLGTIDWAPAKHGTTLWRIGEADRQAGGFALSDAPRAYDNALRCPKDLTFTIGKSNEHTDWYFCQPAKGVWKIKFQVKKIKGDSVYFTAAVAGATLQPIIRVLINGEQVAEWTRWYPKDAAVYRSANQGGVYDLRQCVFPASLLKKGTNTLELAFPKQRRRGYGGILWDCIKMEVE